MVCGFVNCMIPEVRHSLFVRAGAAAVDIAVSQYESRERHNLPLYIFWNDGLEFLP